MDATSPETPRLQANRRRARSPATSDNQDETGSRSQKRRRTRDLSPASFVDAALRMMEQNKEESAAADRAWEAEIQRRQNLSPMARLREDGQKLQGKILSDQDMFATLEESRSARARCRAGSDCIYVQAQASTGGDIASEFRIRVDGVKNLSFWRPATHYYHVACFDQMVDLEDLLPAKFQLDRRREWGVMITKWFEHKGCITLDKLTTYFEACKAYKKKHSDFGREWGGWLLGHRRCEADQATCACPPKPQSPERPVLEDCAPGGEESCSLSDLMRHPDSDDLYGELWLTSNREG